MIAGTLAATLVSACAPRPHLQPRSGYSSRSPLCGGNGAGSATRAFRALRWRTRGPSKPCTDARALRSSPKREGRGSKINTQCIHEPAASPQQEGARSSKGIDLSKFSAADLAKIQELIEQEAEFGEGEPGEPPIPSFRKEDLSKEVGSTGHTLYEWLQYWQMSAKQAAGEEWVDWSEEKEKDCFGYEDQGAYFGPPALLLAGYPLEVAAMTRAHLDSSGIDFVQVVPVTAEMLSMPLATAVQVQEPDWSQPCVAKQLNACAAPHVIIMSGVDSKEAGIIDNLLRKMGLPMMAIGRFQPDNAEQLLGDLCAEVYERERAWMLELKEMNPEFSAPWEENDEEDAKPGTA